MNAPTDTFAGSRVRHGTHSGWRLHQKRGERPCDPCYRAKADYNRRRRSAPDLVRAARRAARAQRLAYKELAHRYPAEYAALYAEHKAAPADE